VEHFSQFSSFLLKGYEKGIKGLKNNEVAEVMLYVYRTHCTFIVREKIYLP
jgi:hypothetical protein